MSKVENIPTPAPPQRTMKEHLADAHTVDDMNSIVALALEKGIDPSVSLPFMNRCDDLGLFYDPETRVVQADLPFADPPEVPA